MFVCNNRCWKFELASASSSGGKTSSGSAKKWKLSLTSTKLAGSLLSRQWLVIAFHIPSWKREERYTGTTHSKSAAGGEPDILAYSPYKICSWHVPATPKCLFDLICEGLSTCCLIVGSGKMPEDGNSMYYYGGFGCVWNNKTLLWLGTFAVL